MKFWQYKDENGIRNDFEMIINWTPFFDKKLVLW